MEVLKIIEIIRKINIFNISLFIEKNFLNIENARKFLIKNRF